MWQQGADLSHEKSINHDVQMAIQSKPINTDTEGAIERVRINRCPY